VILNVVSVLVFIVIAGIGIVLTAATGSPTWVAGAAVIAALAALSPRVAQQWERAVVLRLGRFIGLQGPGLFWIVPFIDVVARSIDQRMITTAFAAADAQQFAGIPVKKIKRVPMLAPEFFPNENPARLDDDSAPPALPSLSMGHVVEHVA